MSELAKKSVILPTQANGRLMWLFIDGEGKKDLKGRLKYTAQVVLTAEQAEEYVNAIDEFWEENRPSTWKVTAKDAKLDKTLEVGKPKPAYSLGYSENEDGDFVFNFKTNPVYSDGEPKIVDVYNARAKKISLAGKKIGNDSIGAIGGVMSIYEGGGNCGVTFYLNSVQLVKFIEFSSNAGFETQEDGFEGVDTSMDEFEDVEASQPQPRL